ncbi:hypothetical protein B0H19DRAFT_1232580 [Mycena capillaripes]|nr:hypothetical protein B0H19DRAFT_1232580 [Mycena capillaripes]
MPSSSSDNSADSGRSLFDHPRRAPLPPTPASRSAQSSPEGFVVPVIPPTNDPLIVTCDNKGHRQLPHVSFQPLGVDDTRVLKLSPNVRTALRWVSNARSPKRASRALLALFSAFRTATGPTRFGSWNLQHCRDLYLLDEREELMKSVKDGRLAPLVFDREFERAQAWFYSSAQGAISRFMVNTHATRDIAIRGYHSLAAAATDPSTLLRFLSLGTETHVHPLVLQVVAERVQSLFMSLMY